MTVRPAPIPALVRRLDDLSAARSARASCTRWGEAEPVLAGYPTAAQLADAIRTASPSTQDELIGALLRQAGSDELAQLTVVAGLSRRLGWIVTGWRRAGVAGLELIDLESDLVSECWAAVALIAERVSEGHAPPPRPAMAIVQAAWQRVRALRSRQRRHDARVAPVGHWPGVTDPSSDGSDEELAVAIISAYQTGRIGLTAARLVFATRVAGWSVADAAALLGCSPQSVRTRRARAERRLAA